MSTKGTLWMSDDRQLHIYNECFDDEGNVYIGVRMNGESVDAEVTIVLPPAAVNAMARTIRPSGAAAEESDDDT